jgi:hypothetical protein
MPNRSLSPLAAYLSANSLPHTKGDARALIAGCAEEPRRDRLPFEQELRSKILGFVPVSYPTASKVIEKGSTLTPSIVISPRMMQTIFSATWELLKDVRDARVLASAS